MSALNGKNSRSNKFPKRTAESAPTAGTSSKQYKLSIKSESNVKTETEKTPSGLRVLTGSIERVLYLSKQEPTALFEIFCILIGIQSGSRHHTEKILKFRNTSGSTLDGVFYDIDEQSPQLHIGALVRVIGRFRSQGDLQVLKITKCTPDHLTMAKRLETISTYVVGNLNKK